MAVPNPALLSALAGLLLEEEAAARAAALSGAPRGPITGFPSLDNELGGFLAPGLHILLAAPGAGKTAFCLQIAAQCGTPALFVTAEMRRVDLLRRAISRTTGTYLGRLRGGELGDQALARHIETAALACPQLAIYDATQPVSTGAMREAAEGLRSRFPLNERDNPHVLVVLDSLTDWAASLAGEMTEYQANETALNELKTLASSLNCPILVIVHRNRAGQKAEGESQMFTGKATGRVEYIAESLWNLESFGDKEPNGEGCVQRRLTLLKNRNGTPFRSLMFSFEGRLQKFAEV